MADCQKRSFSSFKDAKQVKRWIFGNTITVWSGHNPLTYLTESTPKSLLRWSLALQEFSVTFRYRAGRDHVVPDLLTSLCEPGHV